MGILTREVTGGSGVKSGGKCWDINGSKIPTALSLWKNQVSHRKNKGQAWGKDILSLSETTVIKYIEQGGNGKQNVQYEGK